MGTRNLTRVISNGKLVLCQYGQWDGYPTFAGRKVLEFVRKGEFNALKGCTLSVTESEEERTYTGVPANDLLDEMDKAAYEITHSLGDLNELKAKVDKTIKEKFGERNFILHKLASRDTGVGILDFITIPVTTYCDEYLYHTNASCRQIEAVNTINFDDRTVEMWWHEKCVNYTFEQIAEMSEEDIERYMKEFEND